MKNIFFFVICFLLFSCSGKNKVPTEIIQPQEMQGVLWDVLRAQALSSEMAKKDSTIKEVAETKILTRRVFEIHRITSSAFDQSYLWYTAHPEIMRTLFDSISVQNQRENELQRKDMYKQPHKPAFKPYLKRDSLIKSKLR